MKILLLIPRLNIGGAETHVALLAPLLRAAGHQVYLASGGGALADQLKAQGFSHTFVPMRLSTDLSAFCLRFLIKLYRIELVHAHSAAAGITAVKCRDRYCPDLKVVYTAHGLFGRPKELILCKCDKIIAVSQCVRAVALENGCRPDRVAVIYNGIDTKRFCPHENERDALRAEHQIPPSAFCISLVARIKNLRNKGHAVLLQILAEQPYAKDWHLLLIGSGKGVRQLKRQIAATHLRQRVHFLGHRTDVERQLAAVDVVTLPSRFETFGLALAEGMAMQKPGVAFDVGGIKEMLDNGRNGYLVPYGDTAAFGRCLQQLAQDHALCMRFGQAARQTICTRFSIAQMLQQILALYEEVLSSRA